MDEVAVGPPESARPTRRFALSRHLGIRGRLVALVAVVAATAVACVGVAVAGMLTTRAKAESSYAAFKASQVESSAFEGWITDNARSTDAVGAQSLHDPQVASTDWQQIQQGYRQALNGVDWLVKGSPTSAVRLQAERTRVALVRYDAYTRRFHRVMLAGLMARATWIVTTGSTTSADTVRSNFLAMGRALAREAGALAAGIGHGVSRALLWVVAVGLLALLCAVLFTGALMRSITRPLARIARGAETLGDGYVDVDILDIESRDEIGQMARAFSGLIDRRQE
ncbi:MAG TPA: HAMP domain-containing protein, partial [Solirubrobacteraceae bacterium]|nr:HAMP domain-containing protein [Solirubrobacteraceae bacterium]